MSRLEELKKSGKWAMLSLLEKRFVEKNFDSPRPRFQRRLAVILKHAERKMVGKKKTN